MKAENIPLYDLADLKNQTGNDDDFLLQMVILFIKQTGENLERIAVSVQQKNWGETHFVVHKMKPTINLFGIKSLKQIIVETEELTRDTINEKRILENLKLIEKVLKQSIAQLKIEYNIE